MNFIEDQTAQKLRGGYYTPSDLARFLARWVCGIDPKTVLEPSCGDGVFFRAIGELPGAKKLVVRGFELDPLEARKAREEAVDVGLNGAEIESADFLGWAIDSMKNGKQRFDGVVGNPPFIRYQYLPCEFQARAETIFEFLHLPFTKHTNAWVPFILASFSLLRPGGRLAMVVPAEIIHVMHAQSLRTFLGLECSRLVIVDPEELWFEGTLQGAVLLMAEKKTKPEQKPQGLGVYRVKGRSFLDLDPEDIFNAPQAINGKTVQGKWTRAFLDLATRTLLDDLLAKPEVHKFTDIAKVDVGIVTGANNYFLVTDETVEQYDLARWAYPMFGRSEHCPGVIYDQRQHEENARDGNPTNFIWFNEPSLERNKSALAYIRYGEEQNLHTRYKCRIRKPWYAVPSVYTTEIGMLKRSHNAPRLILNRVGAYTTDTAYRIRSEHVPAGKLVYCFVNALTSLSAELEGRHYGGGVLELVPSEIEKLFVPIPKKLSVDLAQLDESVRTQSADKVIEQQTGKVLGALAMSKNDQARLIAGWRRLRDRRHRTSNEEVVEA